MKRTSKNLIAAMALISVAAVADDAKPLTNTAPTATVVVTPPVADVVETKPAATQEDAPFDAKNYHGIGVRSGKKLQFVAENPSQQSGRDSFAIVRVKGIKTRGDKENGRVRIAVWDEPTNYAQEGNKPYRASSFWAKDADNGELVFRIGGLEKGKSYSFFAHFDKENRGFVKKFLGIPTEPFLFTNAKNQGKGKGLTREGLSAPKFENTLVKFEGVGQEIIMEF